tara:strand:+ start:3098 stop:3283 length:186 start_codon:yes stop_codon:yes gene_type:complete
MFTDGQKIFAIVFIVVFLVAIAYQFYKDRKKNKTLFKGTYWVLITIMVVMLAYVTLTKLVH